MLSDPNNISMIPNIIIKSALKNRENLFNMCHLNINSLFGKLDEIKILVNGTSLDVLTFSETKLDTSIPCASIELPNYNIIRRDRNRRGGGGLFIFSKFA